MLVELLLRFFLGGLLVSVFALVGGAWQPKSFAGLFGAAPSVAIVSLALAYAKHDSAVVREEAVSMIFGSLALVAYSALCVVLAKSRPLPLGKSAILGWSVWLGVAFALSIALRDLPIWNQS
jgi:hypothetical protein